jgi:hypothetical protein
MYKKKLKQNIEVSLNKKEKKMKIDQHCYRKKYIHG